MAYIYGFETGRCRSFLYLTKLINVSVHPEAVRVLPEKLGNVITCQYQQAKCNSVNIHNNIILYAFKDFYTQFGIGAFGFGEGFFGAVIACEYDAETPATFDFGFAEKAYLDAGFFQDFLQITKFHLIAVSLHHYGF